MTSMNVETNRLNTFSIWPSSAPVDPIRIAKAGFFYTGEGMEVQCFSCGGKISEWNHGDQVMYRHRQLAPNCVFVVNPQDSGNVPLVLGGECVTNDIPSVIVYQAQANAPESAPVRDYGLRNEDEMYKNDALRLLSFNNWEDTRVSRESLANAGFYHAGEGLLRCAWCGGECRLESLPNEPIEVHRMYFPECPYLTALSTPHSNNTSPPTTSPSYTPPIQTSDPNISQLQSSGAAHNERVLNAGSAAGTVAAEWRRLGVVGGGGGSGGAKHPAYAALEPRLASFAARWPADRTQTPKALADAGFFYTGTDDQVRCFYCDGGLGKWESGDAPWREHAQWFPHCGFVLLVKGQRFVDSCRANTSVRSSRSAESALRLRFADYFERQLEECMESEVTLAALGAGLDAARVRRALVRRLRMTGTPFTSSEALIDAVLDAQLNEEAWSVSPQSHRLARDILAETLRDFAPTAGIIPQDDSSDSRNSQSESPAHSPRRLPITVSQPNLAQNSTESSSTALTNLAIDDTRTTPVDNNCDDSSETEKKPLSLEEENRQLKEARLCKVCMDSEVSVVFLPCGHLVSCGRCGAALAACPLCRAGVRALVRAYLA